MAAATSGTTSPLPPLAEDDGLELLLDNTDALDLVLRSAENDAVANALQDRDVDLQQLLADSDKELAGAKDAFVEAHCLELDNLCRLYREVRECEGRLQAFEDDISSFQGRLTETAEGIVRMQTSTVDVVHRITNRKAVSHKLKEVYEALNQCDVFCDNIASASNVDAAFLNDIRLLESRIAFLADNAELEHSAVHADFHPKLEAAALRAGDKLHKYLLKKLATLAEENTNVALAQQAIERQGQYAFAFLSRYNEPIANDIVRQYVKLMSEVYARHMKPIGKEVAQMGIGSHGATEVFIPPELIEAMGGPRAPKEKRDVSTVRGGSTLGSTARQPSRSISMSIGLAIDKIRGKTIERREATFVDNVAALRAIDVSYRLVVMDPTVTHTLEHTTCWVNRFSELYCRLVNNVINEGRFIDHFFFVAGATTEQEEAMLHSILDRSFDVATDVILSEIPFVTDPVGCLCAMRALELFKNFVTQSADPLPIIIMAELFERVSNAMSKRLDVLLKAGLQSLADANNIVFKPFPGLSEQAQKLRFCDVVAHDAVLAASLQPHDAVRRFALASAQLHVVNTTILEGSRVSPIVGRHAFDDTCTGSVSLALRSALTLVGKLAQRHKHSLSAAIFEVTNIGHILLTYAHAEETLLSAPPPEPRTPRSPDRASREHSDVFETFSADFGLQPGNLAYLQDFATLLEALKEATVRFVHMDISASAVLTPFVDLMERCTTALGDDFFAAVKRNDDGATAAAPTPVPTTFTVSEAELVSVLGAFQKGWQEAISVIADALPHYFPERNGELGRYVLRVYLGQLVVANSKARLVAERLFPKNGALRAKLVGGVAFTHEVSKHLKRLDPAQQ